MAPHDSQSISQRGDQLQGIAIVFLALSWFFIALRTWTRTFVISNFGWDDSTMILAGMVYTVYCASILYIEAHGGGTHVTSVAQLTDLTKWTISGEVTYIVTVMILKLSLGIFFARIVIKSWQLSLIYVTVAAVVVSSMASSFYCLFRCGGSLDKYVARQLANQCTPRVLDRFMAYQHAAFATSTDCVFATLPVSILWGTNMNRRSKVSVGVILSLAFLGCVCSAIRFQYVDGLTQVEDFFWNAVNVSVWSTIEPGAGIIAGCLATLRPFFKHAYCAARSIQTSASRSIKQVSQSVRSDEHASKQRSAVRTCSNHSQSHHPFRDTQAELEAHYGEFIEMRSKASKNDESVDLIISERCPSRQRRSLELDKTSTHTTRSRDFSEPSLQNGLQSSIPVGMRDLDFENA